MITVHHLGASQSERIVWLFEELGLPYELKRYERTAERTAPPEFKALHPQGTAPLITEGKLVLAETGAIMEYVLTKYGKGKLAVKPGAANYADYLYWLHYSNGSFVPGALMAYVANGLSGGNKEITGRYGGRLAQGFRSSEARLGEVPYFAGKEFTAADIMMSYPLTGIGPAALGGDLSGFPNIDAYLKRIRARPAYQRAMAKAEPGK
jgi:glutathione S-transferase